MENTNTIEMLFSEVSSLKNELRKLISEVKKENAEQLFTKEETAKILKVSVRTISNYIRERKLIPTYHTRGVRFTQKEIDRYIRENTII